MQQHQQTGPQQLNLNSPHQHHVHPHQHQHQHQHPHQHSQQQTAQNTQQQQPLGNQAQPAQANAQNPGQVVVLPHQNVFNLGVICNHLMGPNSAFPGPIMPQLRILFLLIASCTKKLCRADWKLPEQFLIPTNKTSSIPY